jgi:predicted nucleic acid-binding protein
MAGLIYILDTNVISDLIQGVHTVTHTLTAKLQADNQCLLCWPVYYEVLRGLIKANASRKVQVFHLEIVPNLGWMDLISQDWLLAAQFWANAHREGRQMSDVDLLVASMARRLDASVISADEDFAALPVKRENWRL